ncbi:uncharacterized protein LOC116770628 isoform X2 [Danaus plexippus]|uniref:uncharacterized protein LOC116770628 isoform X2 n=1 Tax=Danaus plexippus TaxID=13037 RepID=UPI002AAF83C0|nr:uncharacterized protein LOC116770628 isoform X2 [Danaus plexippus]
MARTVRKLKRGKGKEAKQLPAIIITPPELDMKFKSTNYKENSSTTDMEFSVHDLIAQLSENSKASKEEIESIQRKLLHQASEILKVDRFANQPPPDPRVVSATQKYNGPIYGRPISIRRQSVINQDAQLVPEKLQENVSAVNKHQVNVVGAGRGDVFNGTGSEARVASARDAAVRGTSEPVPPYRMPPAPEAALPGAPAPPAQGIHTHAKFPIERDVILSSGDKNSKVPILQEARKRGRLGAVAPDTPPKALSAWTHTENQQAGPSGDFRQYEQNYGYAMHQNVNPNQGAVARNIQNYDSPKPPVPAKNTYKPEQNNSHITVTVETGKDNTKDAPKSNKSVSKTYHTLKDMISSRFKNKDGNDAEKNNEEARLNNNEERKKPDQEPVTPRETPRKVEQGIYGRPMPQNRPDMQYNQGMPNNMAYHSPSPHRQLIHQQQQIVQQQMMLNHQARSQEMLAHRPQALGADALYQYGPPGRRSAVYQREDLRSLANFTSLKTTPQPQFENSHSRLDLRSPQQLERDIGRQRGLGEGRRAASHPHLLEEIQHRQEIVSPQIHNRSRRNSQANLLDGISHENDPIRNNEERESDDGGFRLRHATQSRLSYEERIRTSGRSLESHHERSHEMYRRTPDSHKESRRTPDSLSLRQKDEPSTSREIERNDESASQKSADSVYNSSGKAEAYTPQPSSSRQTPSRIEDLKAHGKKGPSGSGASSGRGSAANSSGRRAETIRAPPHDATAAPENEWADLVECELRQILEPKLSSMRLDSSASSDGSVTPPLPPLSPSSDLHKRNSLPGRVEYSDDRRRRESPRWPSHSHSHSHKKSSKRDHHYKKHSFGPDTTDVTSTTTRSLDLSSLLDARTDSDASTDARAIRRQLRGLENMYGEVLQLLGVRKPAGKNSWEARLTSKRRYGSMSSLPSSSVSSRPVRDKRRSSNEHRKKNDYKGINKRFQRLESHVVTLARSVAHLSSEMRTHHLVLQEMDTIRAELAALRHMYRSGAPSRRRTSGFSDPERVKRLTKFFGDEPPLMRLFLKKLGYEKYAALLEKEKVGAAELPYVGEDKLRALGVPLGPRMRILKEAGIHQDLHLSRDDHNTTTTLAIV